jgi:hypothetical protein
MVIIIEADDGSAQIRVCIKFLESKDQPETRSPTKSRPLSAGARHRACRRQLPGSLFMALVADTRATGHAADEAEPALRKALVEHCPVSGWQTALPSHGDPRLWHSAAFFRLIPNESRYGHVGGQVPRARSPHQGRRGQFGRRGGRGSLRPLRRQVHFTVFDQVCQA